MMINLTESILSTGHVEPEDIAKTFARGLNPGRGYGLGTLSVLSLILKGIPFQKASRAIFPDGSCGNGAAMRVAPVGLLYWWDTNQLLSAATQSSLPTHAHPLGIEGARIIALCVGLIIQGISREDIPAKLLHYVAEGAFQEKVQKLNDLCINGADIHAVSRELGNGVLAQHSVPSAIYIFVKYGHRFEWVMENCLNLGGDTDTIAAMAGALTGAVIKEEGLPKECLQRLENAEKIRNLSIRLFELSETLRNQQSRG